MLAQLKNWVDPFEEGWPEEPHVCTMRPNRRCPRCREESLSWDLRFDMFKLPIFRGLPGEDPLRHAAALWNTVRELKPERVSMEAAWLMAFPISLCTLPTEWFCSMPRRELMTWDQIRDRFIAQYSGPGLAA